MNWDIATVSDQLGRIEAELITMRVTGYLPPARTGMDYGGSKACGQLPGT